MAQARRRFMPAADAVMRRAQDAGRLRPDLAMTDLQLIFSMVSCVIQHTHLSLFRFDGHRRCGG
ncbi:hypothetical protein CG747_38400 [Streptomyces sp. CB02959]|nr:hypothetical protein CG747_38400 [Streptomyces sp. CB02959]